MAHVHVLLEGQAVAGPQQVVAGDAAAVETFTAAVKPQLARGQRMETIQDARPEVRSALDRASRFLGLAALVSVVLAAVAVAMAARRHSERHLSGTAVMRCLGAQQRTLVGIHVGELVLLGLAACTVGVLIAFGLQWGIGSWLQQSLKIDIPPAGLMPALQGYGVGMIAGSLMASRVVSMMPFGIAILLGPFFSVLAASVMALSLWFPALGVVALAYFFFGSLRLRGKNFANQSLTAYNLLTYFFFAPLGLCGTVPNSSTDMETGYTPSQPR